MSAPHEPDSHDGSIELAFDIAKGSEHIKFLGLVDRGGESANTLVGLFAWTCQTCGTVGQDTAALKPQEEFLAEWSCHSCSRVTRVQFCARAGAEWIAQHTLAVAGKASLTAGGRGQPPTPTRNGHPPLHKSGTKALVWLAVAVLAVIVLMGVLDLRQVSFISASSQDIGPDSSESTPSKRLIGCWVNQTGDHVVYFAPVDRATRRGTYILVSRSQKQARTVQFKVVLEETQGEQLAIREEVGGLSSGSEVRADPEFTPSEVTFYVPTHRRSMTRVDIRDGEPVMTTYHNADLLDGR